MPGVLQAYSFLDVMASISGPGGSFPIGSNSAPAKEGLTVEMLEAKNTLLIGADGQAMHSLHGSHGGTVTVRLLKTSPTNALLIQLYNFQRGISGSWGQNNISITDNARGDDISCQGCAFARAPNIAYAEAGDVLSWAFASAWIEHKLGGLMGGGESGIGLNFGISVGVGSNLISANLSGLSGSIGGTFGGVSGQFGIGGGGLTGGVSF